MQKQLTNANSDNNKLIAYTLCQYSSHTKVAFALIIAFFDSIKVVGLWTTVNKRYHEQVVQAKHTQNSSTDAKYLLYLDFLFVQREEDTIKDMQFVSKHVRISQPCH